MTDNDELFLREALDLARRSAAAGGGPFGALVVKDGEVISRAANRVVEGRDPTAHAEVEAIRAACRELGTHVLDGCTVYASCEPCPMCLAAIHWSRAGRVVCAASREDAAAAGFDDALLYDELRRSADQRRLPLERRLESEGSAILAHWSRDPSRRPY